MPKFTQYYLNNVNGEVEHAKEHGYMNEWHNLVWYQEGWFPVACTVFLVLALVGAAVWFIDGIRKYAYWWHKDEDEDEE